MEENIKRTFMLLTLIRNIFTRFEQYNDHLYKLETDSPYIEHYFMSQEEREKTYIFYDLDALKKYFINQGKSDSYIAKKINERKKSIEIQRQEIEEYLFTKEEIIYYDDLINIVNKLSNAYKELSYNVHNLHHLFELAFNNLHDEDSNNYLENVSMRYINDSYNIILSKTKNKIPVHYENDYKILENLIKSEDEVDDGRLPIPYYNQNVGSYSETWHDGTNEALGRDFT